MKAILFDYDMFKTGYDFESKPVLFESDKIHFGLNYHYNGKIYKVSSIFNQIGYCGVKELKIDNENEACLLMDNVTCPACGYENHDSWELSDEDNNYECGGCGAILSYEREIEVTYSSNLIKAPEIIRLED